MGINNPLPLSLKSECKKAAKVLTSFVKPNQALGPDKVIPLDVLKNAKGLAIITVLKAGFLFSGRAGSGVVVARLPDGSWSAPSAIVTAGAGVGGQIGAELTDFVFILNTDEAVKSFAQYGSVTLGGNISVAAGPLGRNAELAGTASLKAVAPIFAYSKTKGLFAGVSLEGSAIMERREANRKFYGDNCKARYILLGKVRPPPACEPLFRVLDSRAFNNDVDGDYSDDEYYDDMPSRFSDDSSSYQSPRRSGSRFKSNSSSRRYNDDFSDEEDQDEDYYGRNSRKPHHSSSSKPTSWEDDIYDRSYKSPNSRRSQYSDDDDEEDLSGRFRNTSLNGKSKPFRPSSEKPQFGSASQRRSPPLAVSKPAPNTATAAFTFEAQQPGDLPFKKGDIITIIQKSNSQDDWWTGRVNGKEGIFPANYVKLN